MNRQSSTQNGRRPHTRNNNNNNNNIKDFLDPEDSLDLSISVLTFPYYCVRSEDTGKPIVGDDLLPFLSHVSSIALDFWILSSSR
jgi:hypothetical protein